MNKGNNWIKISGLMTALIIVLVVALITAHERIYQLEHKTTTCICNSSIEYVHKYCSHELMSKLPNDDTTLCKILLGE